MADRMGAAPRAPAAGTKNNFEDSDFNGNTLQKGEYVTVAAHQADRTTWLAHGYEVADAPDTGYTYANMVSSPDSGTTLHDITGKMRFVVFEDSRMDELKAIGPVFDLSDLKDAETEARTDRPILPLQDVGAGTDQFIAVQIRCDNSTNSGEPVYVDGSSYQIPYTEIPANR